MGLLICGKLHFLRVKYILIFRIWFSIVKKYVNGGVFMSDFVNVAVDGMGGDNAPF